MTALTFGWASAADLSMLTILAWAIGERRIAKVQHAGQFDVVAELAEPADQTRVLLAEHPPEPGRLLVVEVVVRCRDRVGVSTGSLGDGHDALTSTGVSCSFLAAHWMERTIVA